MSAAWWIAAGVLGAAGWVWVSIRVGLRVGRVIAARDRQVPRDASGVAS